MVLKCIVLKCLEEADRFHLKSVSFPALGTGTLKYLHKKVAETMIECVHHYGKQKPSTNIKVVNFIIYKAVDIMQAFYDAHFRMLELPSYLTLEVVPKDVLSYLESSKSNSRCLLRIAPKFPFEKIPLDIVFTLDAESQHAFSQNTITKDKILNRLQMCVSINGNLPQAVQSCLNASLHYEATSVAFAFKTAKVQKQDIDIIATTFLEHKTEGQVTICYILLEDMELGTDLARPSKPEGMRRAVFESIANWISMSSTEIGWLRKEAYTTDIFKEVSCLTIVSPRRDQQKSLTAEVEGYLHRPLEWVFEKDGKNMPVSPDTAKGLTEGFEHPSKQGFVNYKGRDYEFNFDTWTMFLNEAVQSNSTIRIAVKVDQDLPEKKQMKTFPSLNDVFEDVSAEVNPGLENLLQSGVIDVIKQIKLSASLPNRRNRLSGNMEDVLRMDNVLRNSSEKSKRAKRKDPLLSHVSDFESSLDKVIKIPITNLEYLALEFYMQENSLWQTVLPNFEKDLLLIKTDQISVKEANQLEKQIKVKLHTLQSVSWGDLFVEDQFKDKVEDGIREMQQNADFKDVFCHFIEETGTIHIFSQKYDDITRAKHKIQVVVGAVKVSNRRGRRFDKGSSQVQVPDQRPRDIDNSFRDGQNANSPHFPPLNTSVFHTSEGLVVKVYSASILHLDVDCIVNAANGDLQHGGGVAFVISNAAGYEFDKESRDYITRFGPLRVGEVCTTTAGNLKYKGVIHAVGPRWYEYSQDQKRECLDDLKTAVKNSLEEADIQRFTSIAIPAISSGIFAVPKEHCTQQYYRAVEEYSKNRGKHATLTEVHFIDKDIQMCQLIQTTFTKCFGSSRITSANLSASAGAASSRTNHLSHSFSQPSRQSVPAYHRSQSFSSDERLSGDDSASSFNKSDQDQGRNKNLKHNLAKESKIQYQIGNNLTFHFVIGDITEAITEAIVNPENKLIDSRGRIARAIMKIGGERYQTDLVNCHMLKKLKMTDAIETLAGNCSWKYVLHVVAPRWGQDAVKENQTYERNLQQSYENILCLMDKLKLTSLAMPILGTGDHGYTTPYNTIANVLLAVSMQFAERIQKRKDVFVYCIDKTLLKPMIDVFDERFGESELPAADQKTNTLAEQTEKDIGIKDNQVAVKITENCCICMDTIDKPKKLSCGHVFCTECIDQQFKYKPVCPQCGAVHGKITGDQPPGTMTMRTLKSYGKDGGLPGYNGYDIISITYNFPPGRQGPDHPTPGKNYQGITRPAYLPDNEKGRLVAKLLKIAFDRKLVFTIGSSRTTGQDGVVTWNDIHHKTRIDGGPQAFGYPDPTYLDRVLDELKAKGVTKESLNDP